MNGGNLRQGDIIKTNFDPKLGHEQAGYRPALVVSCNLFNNAVNQMPVLCPITNTKRGFPLHIPLDDRTKTTGVIMCEQIKATDIRERGYIFVERLPEDLLRRVLNIIRQEFDFDEPEEDINIKNEDIDEKNKLIKYIDFQHAAYNKNFYRIIAQSIVPNSACDGILRCFTYKENPRFTVLFEESPNNSAFEFASQWVKEKLCETGKDSAMLWYSQLKGFNGGFLERLTIDGDIYRFLEMHAEHQTETLDIDLRGLTKVLYTPDMLDECIELLENSYTPFLDAPGTYRNDRDYVRGLLEKRDSARCELFFLDKSLIGLYCHNCGGLEFICVSPDMQGKGFGEIILRCALNAIAYDTENFPTLTAAYKNTRAVSLYKKCGFNVFCESARVVFKI